MAAPWTDTGRRTNLPAPLTSFLGRESEIDQLRTALRQIRLLTLTGAGGCGKTRLALKVAAEVAGAYPEGVWWTDLSSTSVADQVATVVARSWGLRDEPGKPAAETIAEQLADADALLLLDNCEQVLDECARLSSTLLRRGPKLRIVATSREPLGVEGEHVWRVPSLDTGTSYRLFVERAGQVRPDFVPTPEESEQIAQIGTRLDGIPLAIELAAARIRMMSPGRIAAGLNDRFRLLTGGGRTALPRQQTLETSMAWSYGLLDPLERTVLNRLSVFAGGFTIDAAEAVCSGGDVDRYHVLDLLSRLIDKSVVQADHALAGGTRYRLLETIRMYARDRLIESGESTAVRDRHRDAFLLLAERGEAELAAVDGPVWLERLEHEHDNLSAALEWAEASSAHETMLRLVTALALFWELRGHLTEGCRWFERALERDDGPSVIRARALWGAAHAAVYHDDYQSAAERAPQALEMGRLVGDEWAMGRALNTLGWLQLWFDPARAREALHQSIEFGARTGDDWAVADGWKMITVAWLVQEKHANFLAALEELFRVSNDLGNKFFLAWYHCCKGWIASRRGEFDQAKEALESSLRLCDEVGEPATAGVALSMLAEVEVLSGEVDAAEARLERFLRHAGATGGAAGVPCAVPVLGQATLAKGDAQRAKRILDDFLVQIRPVGIPLFLSWALSHHAAVLLALGEIDNALSALLEAKEAADRLSNPWLISLSDFHRARVARRQGDLTLAERLQHDALTMRLEAGFGPGAIESLEEVAFMAADQESYAEAARLLGATSALRVSMGFVRWRSEEGSYRSEVDRCRQALGEERFEETFAEGADLSLREAAVYAARGRGERKRPSVGWASLTPTELEVARLVGRGLTNLQIAEELFVSRATVKTHVAHIFTKLGVSSRAALASENTRRLSAHGRS